MNISELYLSALSRLKNGSEKTKELPPELFRGNGHGGYMVPLEFEEEVIKELSERYPKRRK